MVDWKEWGCGGIFIVRVGAVLNAVVPINGFVGINKGKHGLERKKCFVKHICLC
jgi:hypothetical protein